jgi:hypothetical protein
MTNIFRWGCAVPKGQAGFTYLKGIDGQWAIDIAEGRTLSEEFPSEAYFEMNPERPKDVKLGEQHANLEDMTVIGPRLSEFVRGLGETSVDLLPVKILDHKGRVASRDFNIVHTARVVDCLDTVASGATWNPIDPEQMIGWETLTLREGDHDFPKIFRVKHTPNLLFVRQEVAQAIEALGLAEPRFKPLGEI